MQIETSILILFVLIGKLTFAQVKTDKIIYPIDSLTETHDFIIYQTDTFNICDNDGLIQGKGIWILKDSSIIEGFTTYSMGNHGGLDYATCVVHKSPDKVYYKTKEIFYGQYHDNLMVGIWTSNWTNGKKRIELTFENGKIQGRVNLYYDTGELMYSGIAIVGQRKIELKKYTKRGYQPETITYWLTDIADLTD